MRGHNEFPLQSRGQSDRVQAAPADCSVRVRECSKRRGFEIEGH